VSISQQELIHPLISSPYNVYPNFETVFTTLTPQLSFSLQTTFTCSNTRVPGESDDGKDIASEDDTLDDKWEEWHLPSTRRPSYDMFDSYALNHRGYTSLVIRRESNLSADQQSKIKHYLDPAALTPALSTATMSKMSPLVSSSHLQSVGQKIREEDISELNKSRYDLYNSGRSYQPRCMRMSRGGDRACWSKNNGGGEKHAAKLWQRMEEEARTDTVLEDKTPLLKNEGQTVYSIPPTELLV